MLKPEQIFKQLEYMAEKIPTNLYWIDIEGRIIGMNQKTLDSIGARHKENIIGKTVYEIYPKAIADDLWQHAKEIIETLKDIKREHVIQDMSTGALRYYQDNGSPILDTSGNLIGVIGTSIEITDSKEAERLRIENEKQRLEFEQKERERLETELVLQKQLLSEQEKYKQLVEQAIHDLGSPLLSLEVVSQDIMGIAEDKRLILKQIMARIKDISNNLIGEYKSKQIDSSDIETKQNDNPTFVSASLLEILDEKRYAYRESLVEFSHSFSRNSSFSFIEASSGSFKRMLSNLLNNSIEAIGLTKAGHVKVELNYNKENDKVRISISDTGKGMPPELLAKIENKQSFSYGKENGHGIGLTQVSDIVSKSRGSLTVESTPNVGTTFNLEFPLTKAPSWVTDKLEVNKQDLILILDDDISVHSTWRLRLTMALGSEVEIIHFTEGEDIISHIETLSQKDKSRVFLLTDYELYKQKYNGLEVAERVKIDRTVLITSHYNDKSIIDKAASLNIKVIPKQLAAEIKIL